jgi:hypothetical protein
MDTIYPDTEAGAIACLKSQSLYDVKGARAIPDPEVQGVWKVICKDNKHNRSIESSEAIVYLAGYPNPWGEFRKWNDFEGIENFLEESVDSSLNWL